MELPQHFPTFSESKYSPGVALKALADALPHMVWVTDGAGRIIYCNQKYHDYTGSTIEELKRRGISPHLHPEDINKVDETWERSLAMGMIYKKQYRLRNQRGQYRWHLGMARPYYNESGQIERWFGTITDIHDEKMAEDKLKLESQQYLMALRSAKIGAWTWCYGSRFLEVTDSFQEMFGLPISTTPLDLNKIFPLVHGEDVPKILQGLQESMIQNKEFAVQFRALAAGKENRILLARGYSIRDDSGKVVCLAGSTMDVSGQFKKGPESVELPWPRESRQSKETMRRISS